MSGVRDSSEWTIATYAAHNEALRLAEDKFQTERDRRYTEVNIEKEKALKIKETADLAALSLARDIQIYKDEKANELREQINSERGLYASKTDVIAATEKLEAIIKPLTEYMSQQRGIVHGSDITMGKIYMALTLTVAFLGVVVLLATRVL